MGVGCNERTSSVGTADLVGFIEGESDGVLVGSGVVGADVDGLPDGFVEGEIIGVLVGTVLIVGVPVGVPVGASVKHSSKMNWAYASSDWYRVEVNPSPLVSLCQ